MLTLTHNPLISWVKNKHFGHTKTGRFSIWNQGILCSNLVVITRKASSVTYQSKRKIHNLFWNSKLCGSKQNKAKIDINPLHTGISGLV